MIPYRAKVALGVVAIVIVVAVVSLAALPAPGFEPSETNSAIHVRLAGVGFTDDVVDVTAERALVRYTVPANLSRLDSELLVLRSVADTAPSVDLIVLQVYEAGSPVEQVTVEMRWVQAYEAGTLTVDELRGHFTVEPAAG